MDEKTCLGSASREKKDNGVSLSGTDADVIRAFSFIEYVVV